MSKIEFNFTFDDDSVKEKFIEDLYLALSLVQDSEDSIEAATALMLVINCIEKDATPREIAGLLQPAPYQP